MQMLTATLYIIVLCDAIEMEGSFGRTSDDCNDNDDCRWWLCLWWWMDAWMDDDCDDDEWMMVIIMIEMEGSVLTIIIILT